ncbi:hypothetical protein ACFOEY_14425 [Paracandidimonas soli]|uniref:hypothetical protein n=1 Tax=Paracandidimonas soli TaxID=1917182 RepID=UPI00360912C4
MRRRKSSNVIVIAYAPAAPSSARLPFQKTAIYRLTTPTVNLTILLTEPRAHRRSVPA